MDPRNQPSLLERIYSWENLLDAYHEAASEKWYRNDVTAFAANLEENLIGSSWLWASGIVSCSGRSTSRQTNTSTMA